MSGEKAKRADEPTALEVARRVNWYTPPDKVVEKPLLFIAQIMARGGTREILWMRRHFSPEQQKQACESAPPGLFSRRCWAYWGLMLFGAPDARPYPQRFPDIPAAQPPLWPGY